MAKHNKTKKQNITISDLAGMTKRGFDHVDEQFNDVRKDIAGLKSDVRGLKSDVNGLKSDVRGLKSDVADLKTDMVIVKSDIAVLKTDLHETKGTTNKIYNLLDKNLKNQEILKQEFTILKHQGNKIKEVIKDKLGVEIQ